MNDLKPGPLVALGGAVVLIISTFLPWIDIFGFTENGLSKDWFGFTGIFILIIGVAVAALAAIQGFFPQVALPDRIVGYSPTQLILVLGTASFLTTFGLQFRDATGIGILIAWVGAALIIVGAILQTRERAASPPPSAPPPPGGGGDQPGTF